MRRICDEYQDIVDTERLAASIKYGAFKSTHEGLGVLTEEYTELVEAIHRNDMDSIVHEALQVAAVAIRLACSLDDPGVRQRSNVQNVA